MNRLIVAAFVAVAAGVALTGCAQQDGHMMSPACPASGEATFPGVPGRLGNRFYADDVIQIFGRPETESRCHGVDSAVLIQSPGVPAEISTWTPEISGFLTFTAFVSLERRENGTRFIPVYRWIAEPTRTMILAPPRQVPDDLQQTYNFPKCDALTWTEDSRQVVELSVCYMWRETPGADWDIGVTRLRWISDLFGEVTYRDLVEEPDQRLETTWN